jgi:hypothetical protein
MAKAESVHSTPTLSTSQPERASLDPVPREGAAMGMARKSISESAGAHVAAGHQTAAAAPAAHPARGAERDGPILPGFSRRSVVATLLAACAPAIGTAAALPKAIETAVALAPTAPAVATAENPELLALGAEVDAELQVYRTAAARLAKARATATNLWPAVSEELVVQGKAASSRFRGCYGRELDAEGRQVWPPTFIKDGCEVGHFPRNLLQAEALQDLLDDVRAEPEGWDHWVEGDLAKRLELAERYEAACMRATETSGVMKAKKVVVLSADRLRDLAYEVRKHPATSLAGIFIHARVLTAYSEAAVLAGNGQPEDDEHTKGSQAGMILGRGLADALLRVAGDGVARTGEGVL